MAIDNPNHAEDDNNEYLRGGLIGGGAGATIGGLTCYLMDRTPKQPPQVRASATPSRGTAPVSTEFRCVATDADGKVVKYEWDFGDGGKAEGDHGTHVYQRPGTYTATCTATDDDAMTGRATVAVTAMEKEAPPAARIVLRGVNFDFDSSKIRSDAAAILEAAAETLKENPGVSVEVGGYTDSIGTEAYNMGLSDRRASAVVDALAELGVDRSRMTPHGYGESNPVASNDTADGRAQNRRVELTQQ
jgi:outer membrane protein OmpA-like peptidoglycan-associated protein